MLTLTFFHNFVDVFIEQNKVMRLCKGLFRETYSIKEFTFDPHIAYQSFKLTAELHLTRKLCDDVRVSSEKFTQSKSLLLIHILHIKVLNLQLNYTSQGKKFCLFSRI